MAGRARAERKSPSVRARFYLGQLFFAPEKVNIAETIIERIEAERYPHLGRQPVRRSAGRPHAPAFSATLRTRIAG